MSTILIVDDSAVDRRLAGGILEKTAGLKVEYATNGVEGLERIPQVRPDMVLTDMQMPEMDGLDLVGKIRERFPLVPVVLMTAHGSEDLAVQALARGAASYVPKSRLAEELPDVVSSVLAVARPTATTSGSALASKARPANLSWITTPRSSIRSSITASNSSRG